MSSKLGGICKYNFHVMSSVLTVVSKGAAGPLKFNITRRRSGRKSKDQGSEEAAPSLVLLVAEKDCTAVAGEPDMEQSPARQQAQLEVPQSYEKGSDGPLTMQEDDGPIGPPQARESRKGDAAPHRALRDVESRLELQMPIHRTATSLDQTMPPLPARCAFPNC